MKATTVWVYAKNEEQARRNADGEDGYGSWDSLASALADRNRDGCRLPGERLYAVTTTIEVVR